MESYTMLSRFLKSRREKKNDKTSRGAKKKDKTGGAGKDDKSDTDDKDELPKSDIPTNEIDEEGYTLRPMTTYENDKSSFYSSSDSDEEKDTKLRVEIKPLRNGAVPLSASVDELRSTVEVLRKEMGQGTGKKKIMENMTLMSLSPAGTSGRKAFESDVQMKRSQSVSQQIGDSSPLMKYSYSPLTPPIPPPNSRSSPKFMTNNASISRYAELGDIFSEVGEIQPLPFPQLASQRNTPTPTSGLKAIPRPPLPPRPETAMSRTLSPPLPAIPLAVAFHEIVHACFKGNDENQCQVTITGDMMVSFPAGIIGVFANNPQRAQLSFRVKSSRPLDNLVSNQDLVHVQKDGDDLTFDFDMSALTLFLNKHAEENSTASYFNVDILKYHIMPKEGAKSCPLHLVAFWKCEKLQTDLRIDYKYNSSAVAPVISGDSSSSIGDCHSDSTPLVEVCVGAPVDGGVKSMQSKPVGQWFPTTNRACWKIPILSAKDGVGSLRARFEVTNGPSAQGTIAAKFSCENSTLSGAQFNLTGSGYRVSLVKKRFISGKYTCDTDSFRNGKLKDTANHV